MKFEELLDEAVELLRRRRRITYRGLKRHFGLDDNCLADLKEELIYGQRVAADEDGQVIVWQDETGRPSAASGEGSSSGRRTVSMPSAERRQLTVMFCDMVGSTALSERLDPEDMREVIRCYQDVCGRVIAEYDGYIARYMGDGVMIYFGYPRCHEDDAERAVRAGLAIVEAVQSLHIPIVDSLRVRVGMATGVAVVGDIIGEDASLERAVVGETPNLAARLQGLAEPNTVVLGANTRQLVRGLFDLEDLGEHEVKGFSEPVHVWQVLAEQTIGTRFDAAHSGSLASELVGRERERKVLREKWNEARSGRGQAVLISGEPGIGKSRMLRALRTEIEHSPHIVVALQCSAYHRTSPLFPFAEHMRRGAQFGREDDNQERLRKLEKLIRVVDDVPDERIALLAALLSIPGEGRLPPLNVTPQVQRRLTLEALADQFAALSKNQPLLFIMEDLHWADATSMELVGMLIERCQNLNCLMAVTFRPNFTPQWTPDFPVCHLEVSRLAPADARNLVLHVTSGKPLPSELMEQILTKTDGVPLFVEELTKALLESDLLAEEKGVYQLTRPLPPLGIPATLQDSLMARLDAVSLVREVAQVGATIGRSFNYELLSLVSPMRVSELQIALQQLVQSELVSARGRPPDSRYTFKHALVQETAYNSLLRSRRQTLHARIAEVIEERFPDTVGTQPELVAWHYSAAQRSKRAAVFWNQAGNLAIQRSANLEAIQQLKRSLEELAAVPQSVERDALELETRTLLGLALMATRGYAAEEVLVNFARARELCDALGESPKVFMVLFGLWLFHLVRADRAANESLAQQLLDLADRAGDSSLLVEAHGAASLTRFYSGDLSACRQHAEKTISVYRLDRHSANVFVYGDDPGVYGHIYRALALWLQGYPDKALSSMEAGRNLALAVQHPFTIAGSLAFTTQLHYLRREPEELERYNEQCFALSEEQGFPLFSAVSGLYRGWPLLLRGRVDDAIEIIRESIHLFQVTGARLNVHYFLSHLAQAYLAAGRVGEGLAAVDEALTLARHNLDRYYVAELHRLRGELLGADDAETSAEASFRHAMDMAKRRGARALELRAATSLSRLLAERGRCDEARMTLADIYGWFGEGWQTGDLCDAKAQLERLT